MKAKKILYGVCGIGSGHTYRQLPIIQALAADNTIVIFAYGVSLQRYNHYFEGHPNVTILPVAVPYYAGNASGLDFADTAAQAEASAENYTAINARAMDKASRLIGKPDLVVSDYEPVSAQYAYANSTPLVTIDQQSKYLAGSFPEKLGGQGYKDEVMRLMMFFPAAEKRLACSFFEVEPGQAAARVQIVPPVLRPGIEALQRRPDPATIIVYLTAQAGFGQNLDHVIGVLSSRPGYNFHVFVPQLPAAQANQPKHINFHAHGAPEFDELLARSSGIISTAGHGLLAEAMYLGIPIYAVPLKLYEQQMNAKIIDSGGFGIKATTINKFALGRFLVQIPMFAANIQQDRQRLLRHNGQAVILATLEDVMTNREE